MRTPVLVACLVLALLSACKRQDGIQRSGDDSGPRKSGTASRQTDSDTPGQAPPRSPSSPSSPEALSSLIYLRPDADLLPLVESLCEQPPSSQKNQLFATIYEETQLRPEITRLPLLLQLVRQPDLPSDLQATIRAELRATLQTDHAESWADWSLALDEYLATEHGLLRAED